MRPDSLEIGRNRRNSSSSFHFTEVWFFSEPGEEKTHFVKLKTSSALLLSGLF